MRALLAVLLCVALVVLLPVVAVCGVVGLAEAPMEAGLTLAELAPEFAECPLGATAVDAECLHVHKCNVLDVRRSLDLETSVIARVSLKTDRTESEHVKLPSACTCRLHDARLATAGKMGLRGPGVHAARG